MQVIRSYSRSIGSVSEPTRQYGRMSGRRWAMAYSGTSTPPASTPRSQNASTRNPQAQPASTTQQARTFNLVGTDATYAYNGGGTVQPSACALSTLSGEWPFSANGNSLSGPTNTGIVDLAGVLQFDGQGNATASWTQASNTATVNVSATGTDTVTAACLGT